MDPLYKEIMDFIELYNEYCEYKTIHYYYLKNIYLDKINKDLIDFIKNKYRMRLYNYNIFHIMYGYMCIITKNEHKNIDKFKEIEEYFKLLLIKILTNNYENIKFDITLLVIYYNKSSNMMMEYLETNGIIYDLDRINPKKIDDCLNWPSQIKIANYLYDKLIRYDKTDLHWAWLGAVIKGQQ